jgi:hypothetical protein
MVNGVEYIKFGWKKLLTPCLVKRYITGLDLKYLCILLGGYITEGSSTFGSRLGASICTCDVAWLEKMQWCYDSLFINAQTCIIESQKKIRTIGNGQPYKDETRKLQMMNSLSAALFAALCGHGSYNKKLPDFAFNLSEENMKTLVQVLVEGDGSKKFADKYSETYKRDNFRYSTTSTELISGLSTILNMLNIKHVLTFRPDKHEYGIWTSNDVRNGNNTNTKIIEEKYDGYVYDLEVASTHTFIDACGQVLLHNTDSAYVKMVSDSDITKEDAEKVGNEVTKQVSAPMSYPKKLNYEGYSRRAIFLAKKRYALWVFERSGDGWKDKVKVKGIETVRRDWCPLTAETMKKCLDLILKEGNIEAAKVCAKESIKAVRKMKGYDPQLLPKLTLTRKYSKSAENYKTKAHGHAQLAERMRNRGDVAPMLGDRIPYLVVAGKTWRGGQTRQGVTERAEDLDYIVKNGLKIDQDYYVEKQLLKPLVRLLRPFGVTEVDLDPKGQQFLLEF